MVKQGCAFIIIFLITLPLWTVQAQTSSGTVAITLNDGNIALYEVATSSLTPITQDGTFQEPVKFYNFPTWASDGQLAFFGVNQDPANTYSLGIFIRRVDGAVKGVYASDEEFFTYAYWSPGDCLEGNCRDLAVLYTNATNGLAVRQVRSAESVTITEIGAGSPFYWDYSPDGKYMLWARFSETLEIYDVTAGEVIDQINARQGIQQAIDWSPVDNRFLSMILDNDGTSDLVVFDNNQPRTLVEDLEGIVAFEWSPDGKRVAYLNRNAGTLALIDATTGAELDRPGTRVLAFFWSPDGTKLAYITLAPERDRPGAQLPIQNEELPFLEWHVYDAVGGLSTFYTRFQMSQDMQYYLGFFDQFARSHRLWSPDSRYLVYGQINEAGVPEVRLLDVTTPDTEPLAIAEGGFGVFSWR